MKYLWHLGGMLAWLGISLYAVGLAAPADPIYVGCTPVPTFSPSLWANCVTVTPKPPEMTSPLPPASQFPNPTITLTPFASSVPANVTQVDPRRTSETLELAPIFATATQFARNSTTTPHYNSSTAVAVPSQEFFSTPTNNPPIPAGIPYVVTTVQGLNVRGSCRSTAASCPPIGTVSYGSVIWVIETIIPNTPNTTLDDYLWGQIGEGQWVALRSASGQPTFVQESPP